MRTHILVTGGAGYIGSHTCKMLWESGFLPVTLDNLNLGRESRVRWGPFVREDARNSRAVSDTITAHQIQAVIHFAADAYVGESVIDPARYYDNNVGGLTGLLAGMRGAGCHSVVFSSTCAVYGSPEKLPISEDAPPSPVNPYGRTKLICEQMLGDYAAAYGIDHIALRYFNASGADPEGDLGEDREYEPHLIPRAMMHLLGHLPDFRIFGSDYPTPDGTQSGTISTSPTSRGRMFLLCSGCWTTRPRRALSTWGPDTAIRWRTCSRKSPRFRAVASSCRRGAAGLATRPAWSPTSPAPKTISVSRLDTRVSMTSSPPHGGGM
jgi:NAD dependent epimerase/dehydratase family